MQPPNPELTITRPEVHRLGALPHFPVSRDSISSYFMLITPWSWATGFLLSMAGAAIQNEINNKITRLGGVN